MLLSTAGPRTYPPTRCRRPAVALKPPTETLWNGCRGWIGRGGCVTAHDMAPRAKDTPGSARAAGRALSPVLRWSLHARVNHMRWSASVASPTREGQRAPSERKGRKGHEADRISSSRAWRTGQAHASRRAPSARPTSPEGPVAGGWRTVRRTVGPFVRRHACYFT